MRLKILSFILLINFYSLTASTTIIPYISTSVYSNSVLESGYSGGLYTNFANSQESVEVGLENKFLLPSDQTSPNIYERSVALLYSYASKKNIRTKVGTHLILSDNSHSNGIQSYFAGIEAFKNVHVNLGSDFYFTAYSSGALSRGVIQIKPYYSFKFGKLKSKLGTIYTKIAYYYIQPIYRYEPSLKQSYNSIEVSMSQITGKFTSSIKAWYGSQLYAVRDKGFTIYNQNETREGGTTLSTRYEINKTTGVKLAYIFERFSEFGNSTTSNVQSLLLTGEFKF